MDWRSRMRAQPCELGEMPPPAPNARSSDGQSRLHGIRLPLVLFAGIRLKPEKIEFLFYYPFLDTGISKDIVHDA